MDVRNYFRLLRRRSNLCCRSGQMTLTSRMVSGGRSSHGCGLVEPGQVMVAGGDSYPDPVSTKVELYSLETDLWSPAPPLPYPLTGSPALVTAGHSLYLLGGYDQVCRLTTNTEIKTEGNHRKEFPIGSWLGAVLIGNYRTEAWHSREPCFSTLTSTLTWE